MLIITRKNVLCRYNSISFFKFLDEHTDFLDLYVKTSNNISPNEIIVHFDDPFSSICNLNKTKYPEESQLIIAENSYNKLSNFQWPIGIESSMLFRDRDCEIFLKNINDDSIIKNKFICNTVTGGPYKLPRSGLRNDRGDMLKSIGTLFPVKKVPFKEYLSILKESTYSLCPEGNGIDTHRFYESISMGSIPIIRKGVLTPLHLQFNAKVVEEWDEVKNKINKNNHNLIQPFFNNIKVKEKMTVGYWVYQSLKNRCKIINYFNAGHIEMWTNFYTSVKKLGLEDHIIVYALDEQTRDYCENLGVQVRTNFIRKFSNTVKYDEKGWKEITGIKAQCVKDSIDRDEFVFYLDTDIVLFQNPFINIFNKEINHIFIQNDSGNEKGYDWNNHCSGCIFLYPTKIVKTFVNEWRTNCNKFSQDQMALNKTIQSNNNNLEICTILSREEYPNGRAKRGSNKVLLHTNWILGNEQKKDFMKKLKIWYI